MHFFDPKYIVPNEDDHTIFLQMDFGICLDENNDPIPMLIKGTRISIGVLFPIFGSSGIQIVLRYPGHFTSLFHGLDIQTYRNFMQGNRWRHQSEQVILLEIEPEKQTTYIDMKATSIELGIPVVFVSQKSGKT